MAHDSSFTATEAIAHWRRELTAALEAEKLVVVLLEEPEIVYAYTGEKRHSGTGRNARVTHVVSELRSYSALPVSWKFHQASGTEMTPMADARFFAPYWSQFAESSAYELFIEAEVKEPVVKTRTGNRVVGACLRKGRGALLCAPALMLDFDSLVDESDDEPDGFAWNDKGVAFGARFTSALVALAEGVASERSITPPPSWTHADEYRLPRQADLEVEISAITARIGELEQHRSELESARETAGELRALLYEQGKPLEHAVLQALRLMGFSATDFRENGSEFDVVLSSQEGPFIGEVEGKDNKPINIDKFSQLERNLHEDFARDEITSHAKGVLFGNAFRLKPLAERSSPFTEKCHAAAARIGAALVHTPDLFAPARYLQEHQDEGYARRCREALFSTAGTIVSFPVPPTRDG